MHKHKIYQVFYRTEPWTQNTEWKSVLYASKAQAIKGQEHYRSLGYYVQHKLDVIEMEFEND